MTFSFSEIGGGAFGAFNVETIEKWLQIHNPTPTSLNSLSYCF
jgi:hypothetical protein